jgi:hypothetical protein
MHSFLVGQDDIVDDAVHAVALIRIQAPLVAELVAIGIHAEGFRVHEAYGMYSDVVEMMQFLGL